MRWCPICGKQYQISMGNQRQAGRKRWIYLVALESAILLAVLGITFRSEISEFLRRTLVEEMIFEECFLDYEKMTGLTFLMMEEQSLLII